MIMSNIEDNAAGTELSDSLEDVINMLDAFQLDMTSSEETMNMETSTELSNFDETTISQTSKELISTETNNLQERQ